ncbi:FKBP12-associated protein [Dimargaris xerosporica]|nr:FKBP12-associated protein [Dimargaris xerosporica]
MDNPNPRTSQPSMANTPTTTQPEPSKPRRSKHRQRRKPGNAGDNAQDSTTADSSATPTLQANELTLSTSNSAARQPAKSRHSKPKAPKNSSNVTTPANRTDPSRESNASSNAILANKDKRPPRRRRAKKLFSQLSDPAQPAAEGRAHGKVPKHLIPQLPLDADLRTTLEHNLRHGTHECMVCYDVVRPHEKTWACGCCWAVFHLHCIKQWAEESIGKRMATAATASTNQPHTQLHGTDAQPSLLSHATISYDRHLSQRERRRANRNTPTSSNPGAIAHYLHQAVLDAPAEAATEDQISEQDAPWACPVLCQERFESPLTTVDASTTDALAQAPDVQSYLISSQQCYSEVRPRPDFAVPRCDQPYLCHELTVCLESPTPCPELVAKPCPCGSRSEEQPCGATATFIPESRVSCTQLCATVQRNRQLAAAFGGEATDTSSPATHDQSRLPGNAASGLLPANKYEVYHPYSNYHAFFKTIPSTVVIPQFDSELLEFVFTHVKWVQDHYTKVIRPFMENPRQTILRFKPMNPTFRQALHLWAQVYLLDSESQDSGANRSVVWTKKPASDCGSPFPLTHVLKVPLRVWYQIIQLHNQSPTGANGAMTSAPFTDHGFARETSIGDQAHESDSCHRRRQARTKDSLRSSTVRFNAFFLANVPPTVVSPDPIIRALGDELVGLQVVTQWWSPEQSQQSGGHSQSSLTLHPLGRHLIITPTMDGAMTAANLHDLVLDLSPLLQEVLVQRRFGDYVEPCTVDHSGQLVYPHQECKTQPRAKASAMTTTAPAPATKSAWSTKPPKHTNTFRALNSSPQVSAWDDGAAITPVHIPPRRPLTDSSGAGLDLASPPSDDAAPMKLPAKVSEAQTVLAHPQQQPIVADSWEELEELL